MTSLDHYLASLPDRCRHGWHRVQGCPECGKNVGMARAEANAPDGMSDRIDAAIRTVAARGREFSANDVRALVPEAIGPLMGARFNAAARAGVIVRVGYTPSTLGNTHAHPIATWEAAA